MLEPDNSTRLARRRLSRRQFGNRSSQPAPMHPLEDRNGSPTRNGGEMTLWQSDRSETHTSLQARSAQPSRPLNREERESSSRQDGNRFNLRRLLSGESASSAVAPLPGGKGKLKKPISPNYSEPEARRAAQSSSSGRSSLKTRRLEPVRPVTPLHKPSSRHARPNLVPTRPSEEVAHTRSKGQVKSLKPYPIAPSAQLQKQRRPQRRPRRAPSPLLYLTRLLILGIGVGAIAGTILSIWDPTMREPTGASQATSDTAALDQPTGGMPRPGSRDLVPGNVVPLTTSLKVNQPMVPLAATMQSIAVQYSGLTPGVFLLDLDSGNYLDLKGTTLFSAASMIKVPILIAFLQDVDAGKIRLDEALTMQQADVASGSGELQYQDVGTQYSALETAYKMITISDNTATNMLITRMGGIEVLNRRFRLWGLQGTMIRNILPDLAGTNTTTPRELTQILTRVSQGDLLSLRSRDRLLEIMRNTITDTLLPSTLDPGAVIAHKTGSIDTVVGDTGIIDMPSGKRYIVTVVVQRSDDDDRAQELIRQLSRAAYQYLNQPAGSPSSTATPPRSEGQSTPDGSPPAPIQPSTGQSLPADSPSVGNTSVPANSPASSQ